MTYRDDHDAAVARLTALEQEHAKLLAENAQLRRSQTPAEPLPSRGDLRGRVLSWLMILVFVGSGILCAVPGRSHQQPTSTNVDVDVDVGAATDLHACKDRLATNPHDPNDLDGRTIPTDVLEHTTGCRREIESVLAQSTLPAQERRQLERWLGAEEQLANAVVLITQQRDSQANRGDHYTSDPQLWREYDRAYRLREAAFQAWSDAGH